jgi:putative addiction module component (TIGR02574 family)
LRFITLRLTISPMSQALPLPPPGFDSLSVDEQIDYLQSLWDRIAARPEDVPVPEWHRQTITERLAAHRADNDQGKEWEEVEREIATELSQRAE